MKIKRIHIDHFGGLSDFTLNFSDGFNLVFGENEQGKTTVLSFIRMMFYSSGTGKSDININLRRRFAPLSGERAGGEIEFSHGGKDYILSKQFGKSAHSDKTLLLDVAKGESTNVSGNIGEEFFSLTWEAFERSVFVGSLESDGKGSAELSRILKSSVYKTDTSDSAESIIKRITDAVGLIRTKKRVGMADKLDSRLEALENERREAERAETTRRENAKEISALEAEIKELYATRDRQRELSRAAGNAALAQSLKAELDERKLLKETLFSLGDFDEGKADFCNTTLREITELSATLSVEKEQQNDSTLVLSGDIDAELEHALVDLQNAEDALSAAQKDFTKNETKIPEKSGINAYFIASIILAFLTLGGIVYRPLFVAGATSIVCLLLGVLKNKKSADARQKAQVSMLEKRLALSGLEEERDKANERVVILRERKKIADDARVTREKADAERKEKIAKTEQLIKEKTADCRLVLKITPAEDIAVVLSQKKALLNTVDNIKRRLNSSPHRELTEEELLEKTSISSTEHLESSEYYNSEITRLESEAKTKISQSEKLKAENESLLLSLRGVAEIETEKSHVLKRRDALDRHLAALQLAAETLNAANDQMRQNFAPELNRLTGELFSDLTRGKHGRVSVSQELDMTVTQDGLIPFSADYLSTGGAAGAELCLRLALARLTGGENLLPLLLDDPLAHFDDERTKTAFKFLTDYANDTQVLFFTCHGFLENLAKVEGVNSVYMKK